MRRRLLSKMLAEQAERNMSAETRARLIQPLRLVENDGDAFQGAAQSSPAGSVPPAQPAPLKRGPGRPRKNLA